MQVFRGYMKVLKKSIPMLLIYVAVFAVILVLFSSSNSGTTGSTFETTKVPTAFINNDTDSILIENFKEYLKGYCEFVEDVGTDTEDLQDALFIRKVEYIITIDEGFEQRFLDDKVVALDKRSVPDSQDGIYIDNAINTYFNTLKSYKIAMSDASIDELCSMTANTLSESATVNLLQDKEAVDAKSHYQVFFNFLSYLFVAGFMSCIGSIMLVFNDIHIKRRNTVSPVSNRATNLQMMLANFLFAFTFFVIMTVVGIAISPNKVFDMGLALNVLNAFVFVFCALAISYIVGLTAKSENVVGAISTVVSLGLAFLSGAFVPQFLLPDKVINVAKFTPNYWYVLVNDKIADTSKFTSGTIKELLGYMGIQLVFALALFCISLVISKKRSQRTE